MTFYQSEIKRYQNVQKKTIDALQNSNVELISASEELERFIYIVSSDLKNRLQKVREQIKTVRKNVTQHQYDNINQPLDKAENTARQMHFWVSDILEFSTIHQSGKRLQEDISFDDIFFTIKNNISEEVDNFENRIVWTNIPSVRLNELEVFIVFYNIIKIVFHYTDYNVKVRTDAIVTNPNLTIQFIYPNVDIKNYEENSLDKSSIEKNEKIKLCRLIVKGWNGIINIRQRNNNCIYEIVIPNDKLTSVND